MGMVNLAVDSNRNTLKREKVDAVCLSTVNLKGTLQRKGAGSEEKHFQKGH